MLVRKSSPFFFLFTASLVEGEIEGKGGAFRTSGYCWKQVKKEALVPATIRN